MSGGATRRNGKAASCEPCRKGKIRCDHQRPVCSRCERRGIPGQCLYHPAPLTKPRAATGAIRLTSFSAGGSPLGSALATSSVASAASGYASHTEKPNAFSIALPATPNRQADDKTTQDERLAIVSSVLALLRHCNLMQMLIREYARHAQAALVPAPIAMAFADSLPVTVVSYALDDPDRNQDGLNTLASDILRNTATPVVIVSQTTVDEFTSKFIGANLRLQTLALMYALTARSCLLGLARDDDRREDLMRVLAINSSTCIRLARDIAPDADDVSLWAAFEDTRLATHLEGDASPRVYRRLGELATDIYALGMHRESATTCETPFYIAECRRKTFVAAYKIDKFVATLMDLPPRILKRYSDCRVPLDLSDEELLSSTTEEQALLKVTSDGWNAEGKYIPATWQRLRFHLSAFHEEILEYRFRPSNVANNAGLRKLSQRLRNFVESLPDHLRYTSGCWDSGLLITVCSMLTSSHLIFLQSESVIHRLLERTEPGSASDVLYVSAETMATILQIGSHLSRAIFLRYDFPYMALAYGLPAASRLAAALQSDARSNNPTALPSGLSRSTIIRNLSVYVSYLESIFAPTDGNYELGKQAATSLSRMLDDILDSSTKTSSLTPISTNSNVASDQVAGTLSSQGIMLDLDAFGMADYDILNGADLETFDLAAWTKNMDWTSGSWN